jgi:hypothetical protein
MSSHDGKTINVFHYSRKFSSNKLSSRIVAMTDKHIENITVKSVQKMLRDVRLQITSFENSGYTPDSFLRKLTQIDDIVFTIVDIGKWRRGSTYLVLQISGKDKGLARLSVYTTDTIFHSAWGTTPDIEQAEKMISDYLGSGEKVLNDMKFLKKLHDTKKTELELLMTIQINA